MPDPGATKIKPALIALHEKSTTSYLTRTLEDIIVVQTVQQVCCFPVFYDTLNIKFAAHAARFVQQGSLL